MERMMGLHPGPKGIRQWPIKGCTSPILINKASISIDYYEWLKRLVT